MSPDLKYESKADAHRSFFFFLVIGLLIASTNLGLVNGVLALKASDGGNLLGIRDMLMVLVLVVGVMRRPSQGIGVLRNRLSRIALLVVAFTPLAMVIGFFNGGSSLLVIRDGFMMFGWLLALVVAANFQDRQLFCDICNAMLLIGLLVAVGVFVEAASFGQIRVVTPSDVVSISGRSTPSGWPLMMISSSLVQVLFIMKPKAPARDRLYWLFSWIIIFVASLLTQSRTFLVGISVSTIVLIVYLLRTSSTRSKLAYVVPLLVGVPIAIAATFALGDLFVRPDFTDHFVVRYSVLGSLDSLIQYSEEDTRRAEVEIGFERYLESPVFGVGLGSKYRDDVFLTFDNADPALTIHNVFAFFLFRYGPVGLGLFLMLIYYVFGSLSVAVKDTSSGISAYGVGLSVGLINLFACAFFGNIFGTTYGVPLAMVALGCLIAYEQIRDTYLSSQADVGVRTNWTDSVYG